MIKLLKAINYCHVTKDDPLPIEKVGNRYYYSHDKDFCQQQYNFARWEIAQHPKLEKVLVKLKWI